MRRDPEAKMLRPVEFSTEEYLQTLSDMGHPTEFPSPTICLHKVDTVRYLISNEYHQIDVICNSLNHAVVVVMAAFEDPRGLLPPETRVCAFRKEGIPAYGSYFNKIPNIRYWAYRWRCYDFTIEIECISRYSHIARFFKGGNQVGVMAGHAFKAFFRSVALHVAHKYGLEYDELKDEFIDDRHGIIKSRT